MNFKLPKCKKGVSPIIATLLLIVIAVAAAVVTYSFVMGFIGTSTNPSGQQGQLTYDAYTFDSSTDELTVYIRNTGSKALTLSACYIGGQLVSEYYDATDPENPTEVPDPNQLSFGVGSVKPVIVKASQGIASGTGYEVRFVCTDGTILTFTAVAS
ncbi:MAG: archaellin/type IV pilin N-terminal domain-containing protein [Candidatus Methanosuratincola sp.]